ncbi:MAG: hypothetical protein ACJ72O_00980 [Marmoricola sp.]
MRSTKGTLICRERLDPDELVVAQGVPATSPERGAFDAAGRAADLRAAVGVLDMALASRVVSRTTFCRYLATRGRRPGVEQVRHAFALAEERTMSPAETVLRLIWLLDAGLPRPRCNWPLADPAGRPLGKPDLLCEELAVVGEFDGAHHRSRERHRDDLRRDDGFRSVGLEPFRVVGADLRNLPLVLNRITTA